MSTGQLRKHERFRSRVLRNQRDLIVYLPPGYDDQPWQRYPVLYLQDGQNLFDRYIAYADAWIEEQDFKDSSQVIAGAEQGGIPAPCSRYPADSGSPHA